MAGERPKTRGKLSVAAESPVLSESSEPTLGTIMKRLEKLDALDNMEHRIVVMDERMALLEGKLDLITRTEERLEKLAEITSEFKDRTDMRMDALAARADESDRQHRIAQQATGRMEFQLSLLKQDNIEMGHKLNDIQNKANECNIKLEGKTEDDAEDLRVYTLELIAKLTNDGVDPMAVMSTRRLGKKTTANTRQNQQVQRPRPVLITFRTVRERNLVYFARTRLRDNPSYKTIYLNDDPTLQTKKMREDYRSVAALVRNSGKEVRLHDDGIVIEGTKYKHAEADRLPSEYSLQRAKTRRIEDGLFFQSGHSFLSNFYPAPIVHDNCYYQTAEHWFQSAKCLFANDIRRHELIIQARSPLDAKKIGDQINETSEWRKHRENALKEALDLKFDQNPTLAQRLIDTGQLTLHEATPNMFYGIGASLHSRELRNKRYSGLNKLGIALEAKRTRMIADMSGR